MNKCIRCALLLLSLAAIAGCAPESPPRQVNMEDYLFQTAIKTCRDKTWDLMHTSAQALRASYFKGCMEDHGYSQQSYRHLWIDAIN